MFLFENTRSIRITVAVLVLLLTLALFAFAEPQVISALMVQPIADSAGSFDQRVIDRSHDDLVDGIDELRELTVETSDHIDPVAYDDGINNTEQGISLTVKVTFIYNNGIPDSVMTIPIGTVITEPVDPFKLGYVFAGWYT
ncbi:MAG: InlB B-repeat-containing protein, partial [Actinomycetia bacterium]|nr:InlB B-repeat-containing protein [Actinomycetes bacterium]